MKNLIPFLLMFLCCLQTAFAQETKYPIPGATEQPQWAFPLFFEDGEGARDTVWIGYDPESHFDYTIVDTQFNEYQKADTSAFNARLGFGNQPPINVQKRGDHLFKAEITDVIRGSWTINFIHGKNPIKMWWDDSLLYADSNTIPFPEIEGRPNFRLEMTCTQYKLLDCHYATGFLPLLITDSLYQDLSQRFTIVKDSFLFTGVHWRTAENSLQIRLNLRSHDEMEIGSTSDARIPEITLAPNPVHDHLKIECEKDIDLSVKIYNQQGKIYYQRQIRSNSIIGLKNLPPSLYIVEVIRNSTVERHRLIKH